jgi:hypothetical protein
MPDLKVSSRPDLDRHLVAVISSREIRQGTIVGRLRRKGSLICEFDARSRRRCPFLGDDVPFRFTGNSRRHSTLRGIQR